MYNNGNFSGVIETEDGMLTLVVNSITMNGNVTVNDNHSTTQRIGKLI